MRRRRRKTAEPPADEPPAGEPPAGEPTAAAPEGPPPRGLEGYAVLVDGDNVPPELLGPVVEHLRAHGEVTERRIYKNWRSTRDSQAWDAQSKRFAFERMDRYRTTVGKNSSDIAVCVGAMDLYYAGHRRFCVVSGDTDFAPLVERLRRGGGRVVIVGHQKDPGLLEEISDEYLRWHELMPRGAKEARGDRPEVEGRGAAGPARKAARPKRANAPKKATGAGPGAAARPAGGPARRDVRDEALLMVLVDSFEVARTDGDVDPGGWAPVSRLGQIARSVDADFGPQKYGLGARTPLYQLFKRFPARFEVQPMGKGRRQYQVRLKA